MEMEAPGTLAVCRLLVLLGRALFAVLRCVALVLLAYRIVRVAMGGQIMIIWRGHRATSASGRTGQVPASSDGMQRGGFRLAIT